MENKNNDEKITEWLLSIRNKTDYTAIKKQEIAEQIKEEINKLDLRDEKTIMILEIVSKLLTYYCKQGDEE